MSSQIMPIEPATHSNRGEDSAALEADAPLREDIRLLGRILGDTVRDQEGVELFDLVGHEGDITNLRERVTWEQGNLSGPAFRILGIIRIG